MDLLKNSSVEVLTPYVPVELQGDGLEVGEGIEKREDNFADEVMSQVNKK